MSKDKPSTKKSDADIATEQGVSRQAIHDRRGKGWTQEEIEAGERGDARKPKYATAISRKLGMSVQEAAQLNGISVSEVYRRLNSKKPGTLQGVPVQDSE